ncbi:MAG TPA: ATP synthase F0 subunit B [Bryobacteraceae bacterium]|nr:ATP synthase F0 subunit B [Bryobacteraceae bacterium]
MEQTVQALGGILLRALPTFFLILFLTFYLKRMLFAPLDKVLEERRAATAGAREAAEALLQRAEQRAAEYRAAIREARSQLFHEQDQMRHQWLQEQAAQVHEAKVSAELLVAEAKAQIAQETASARESLHQSSTALADEIASTILGIRSAR